MSASYVEKLDYLLGVDLAIEFFTERGVLVGYTVVVLLATEDGAETIRVYDSAHGFNEMHRFTRGGGKQPGTRFHSGTLAEGMNAAIDDAKRGCQQMIEGWRNG